MAFGNNVTSGDAILKTHYAPDRLADLISQENKFLGMVKRRKGITGRTYNHSLLWGPGGGRSGSFSQAQAMAALTGGQVSQFALPLIANHSVANLSADLIEESESDVGAFVDAISMVSDTTAKDFANSIAVRLYRGASGAIGQISSDTNVASPVLKFAVAQDSFSVEVGQALALAASEVTGAQKAFGSGAHGLYVKAVDYLSGQVTVGVSPLASAASVNLNDATDGCPTVAVGDYVYVVGDRNNALAGIADWIPFGAVSGSDSFFGVNRSASTRLTGSYLDASSGSQQLSSTIEDAGRIVADQKGQLSDIFMSHKNLTALSKEMGSRYMNTDAGSKGEFGFPEISVHTSAGVVKCHGDRACPGNRMFGVNMDTWELLTVGEPVYVWNKDGRMWRAIPTDAGMEIRFYSKIQLKCSSPRDNIHILTAA